MPMPKIDVAKIVAAVRGHVPADQGFGFSFGAMGVDSAM